MSWGKGPPGVYGCGKLRRRHEIPDWYRPPHLVFTKFGVCVRCETVFRWDEDKGVSVHGTAPR